jgi:beta-lactam-binding protein with PASTA domain
MPGAEESCVPLLGIRVPIADETEITASHEPVPPPGTPPPPDAGPPGFLARDVWPWLAALGILVVAGLLVWILVLRDNGNNGKVVPAVVGMQQQQAVAKLTADGFNVNVIVGPAHKPRGIVVSQVPGGGSRVGKNQKVTLHVSNGRPISIKTTPATTTASTQTTTTTQTTAQSQQVAVPDVSGQDLVSAAGQIEAAGFVAETDPVTDAATEGTVIQQDPAAGTQAAPGSIVRLSIAVGSNRPPTRVPNVVGQKASAARAALLAAKLTVKTVYKKGKTGIVLAETPTGSVPAYAQITITVGN